MHDDDRGDSARLGPQGTVYDSGGATAVKFEARAALFDETLEPLHDRYYEACQRGEGLQFLRENPVPEQFLRQYWMPLDHIMLVRALLRGQPSAKVIPLPGRKRVPRPCRPKTTQRAEPALRISLENFENDMQLATDEYTAWQAEPPARRRDARRFARDTNRKLHWNAGEVLPDFGRLG
jgi:hypothetical protein